MRLLPCSCSCSGPVPSRPRPNLARARLTRSPKSHPDLPSPHVQPRQAANPRSRSPHAQPRQAATGKTCRKRYIWIRRCRESEYGLSRPEHALRSAARDDVPWGTSSRLERWGVFWTRSCFIIIFPGLFPRHALARASSRWSGQGRAQAEVPSTAEGRPPRIVEPGVPGHHAAC